MKDRNGCSRPGTNAVVVRIDANEISDWQSFHTVFRRVFGFPGYYGDNMDAWIDCMSCIGDAGSKMTDIVLNPGDMVVLEVSNTAAFAQRCPDQYGELMACAAIINARSITSDGKPILSLSLIG